jgi:hypothetical protein
MGGNSQPRSSNAFFFAADAAVATGVDGRAACDVGVWAEALRHMRHSPDWRCSVRLCQVRR